MESDIRAFFAFEIPDWATNDGIIAYQAELQKSIGPLKLVDRKLLHLTARFLGDITLTQAKALYSFITEDLNPCFFPAGQPAVGRLQGVGDFGNNVFFIKIAEIGPLLGEIAGRIEKELEAYPTIKKEAKPFQPHLTIARAKKDRNTRTDHRRTGNFGQRSYADLKRDYQNYDFGPWTVAEIVLKKSVLTPRGPIYTNMRF